MNELEKLKNNQLLENLNVRMNPLMGIKNPVK